MTSFTGHDDYSMSPRKSIHFHHSKTEPVEGSSPLNASFENNQSGNFFGESRSSPSRRSSLRYDASQAMDRLRSSFIADTTTLPEPALSATEPFDSSAISASSVHRRRKTLQEHLPMDQNDVQKRENPSRLLQNALGQVPAILLLLIFHLMIGVPFGVSYFPIGWRNGVSVADSWGNSTNTGGSKNDAIYGPFPLPNKEALGIRLFLYTSVIGQFVMTMTSEFDNCIAIMMVENLPMIKELSAKVIKHQGYGIESLATLFAMFGLASVIVGVVFFYLGKYELGRIVYFFPSHVLVGIIGGIGVYLAKTGIEVTMDATFGIETMIKFWNMLRVAFGLEIVLRILERVTLDKNGKPRFTLLSPIYFCMITPFFYLGLVIFQYPVQQARNEGYFFPSIATSTDETDGTTTSWLASIINDEGMFDMFKVLNFNLISWKAIADSLPTLLALILFSLIHVPINIPAFAISTNTDVDMNNELKAHGYSNIIAGICGCGLQNYMAYTQSVVFARSGGRGRASGFAVAILTVGLFFIGPTVASFIPRCMAGALLLHVGIDLALEGVYDSYGKFDNLEYGGIWIIVVCMTLYGMEAAMIAGIIAALSTYAVQSITYLNPIRGSMSAFTLRSSHRNRNYKASTVLDDPINGRSRIIVIQLQGHLFFGNFAQLNAGIDNLLTVKHRIHYSQRRRIVIMDFSLVLGIDSSAAQGLIKLKNSLHKKYNVDVCVFVCGSENGFPCEYDLSNELTSVPKHPQLQRSQSENGNANAKRSKERIAESDVINEASNLLNHVSPPGDELDSEEEHQYLMNFSGSFVLESLDLALIFAENVLIAWEDPTLLDNYQSNGPADTLYWDFKDNAQAPSSLITDAILSPSRTSIDVSDVDEKEVGLRYLSNLCASHVDRRDIELLFSKFQREFYAKNDFLWKQNEVSDSAKLLVSGTLIAILENEAGTSEVVLSGHLIGELGLVQGSPRLSSVKCVSEQGAVVYSLSRESYENLLRTAPHVARLIDVICIQYLANRVQHVSNRIFETRCLPI